jgi:hypothetical protein
MVRSFCLVMALVAGTGAAAAQNNQLGHTPAEERACRGDAHRFCKDDLADEFRVASCLQDHRNQISRACRAVMDSH